MIAETCPPWPSPRNTSRAFAPLRCADYASKAPGWNRVRIVMGVATGPGNRKRRDAIRQTWMRWPSVGKTVVVCFAVGRRQLATATLAALDAEASEFGDLLFLPVSDGCVSMVSIGKAYAFWRSASRMTSRARQPPMIAKADDDSFVNMPMLERLLEKLHCVPRLYLGALAFTGFHPQYLRNCGFAWAGGGAYHKYGCEATGAHPPYPFALGQLQVLSTPLAATLAASPGASDLAATAESRPNVNANEDSAIGFMISHLPNVTYVSLGKSSWHNLGCFPTSGMYRQPARNVSIVVHRLLTVASLRYTWRVLEGGMVPDSAACMNAAIKWQEGPVERLRRFCERCTSAEWKRYGGKAPHGCNEVGGSKAFVGRLREGCVKHGLLAAAPPAASPSSFRSRTQGGNATSRRHRRFPSKSQAV